MDRKAREEKAALVRQAIKAMTVDIKVAKGQRKADLFHDMGLAYQDLEALEDDGMWDDGGYVGEPAPVGEPEFCTGQGMGAYGDMGGEPEVPAQDMFHKTDEPGVPVSPLDEPQLAPPAQFMDDQIEMMAGEKKEESEPNDSTKSTGGDVPMGSMAEHSNVYAWEDVNRQHISYLLDKVADITSAIEQYEHRAANANKKAKSSGARKRISGTMKELASVVNSSDLASEATGKHLDAVGVKVLEMHKGLGLSA